MDELAARTRTHPHPFEARALEKARDVALAAFSGVGGFQVTEVATEDPSVVIVGLVHANGTRLSLALNVTP